MLAEQAHHEQVQESGRHGGERDRAEPRADALARLAGVLSVAPSWLVAGVGEAPCAPPDREATQTIQRRLQEIRRLHEETGEAIAVLEAEIAALAEKSRD